MIEKSYLSIHCVRKIQHYNYQINQPNTTNVLLPGRGHFLHLTETDKRSGFRAQVEFPFMLFNESCLELFYYFLGNATTSLNVSVVSENNGEVGDGNWHDDVIKWKHFPRYWPFVRGIHRSPVNSPHKGQWRGALMFSLICVWINGWVSNREAGDLRRYRAHYDVTVMGTWIRAIWCTTFYLWLRGGDTCVGVITILDKSVRGFLGCGWEGRVYGVVTWWLYGRDELQGTREMGVPGVSANDKRCFEVNCRVGCWFERGWGRWESVSMVAGVVGGGGWD